jgi:hypothetical protein
VVAALASTSSYIPFQRIAIDTIGPLPVDDENNKYMLVGIDCFTRFVEIEAVPDATAKQACKFILRLVGRYGPPEEIQSDQGTQYLAEVVNDLCEWLSIQRRLTLPYRPEANGIVERANQEVMRHLRAIVVDARVKTSWSMFVPLVQRILNFTPHSVTGTTPMRLLFGDVISTNKTFIMPSVSGAPEARTYEDHVQQLNEQEIIDASQKHLAKMIGDRLATSPTSPTVFREGDYVLVSYPEQPPDKLTPKWRGPLVVVEPDSKLSQTYLCQDLLTLEITPYFVDRLKRYNLREGVSPAEAALVDRDEWFVEQVISHRYENRPKSQMEFRVRWLGYTSDFDSWLPWNQVRKLEALQRYVESKPKLRAKLFEDGVPKRKRIRR